MAQKVIQSTTQKFLEIHDVSNNFLILKNGGASLILSVNALNFGLLAEEEQDAIIYQYAGLLNSLNYPIQILIRSQSKDVTNYLHLLKDQEDKTMDRVKKQQIEQYRGFVSNLIQERNVLDKKFYVVIPASPLEMGVVSAKSVLPGVKSEDISSFEKSVILEKARNILEPKRDHLVAQFGRIGLFANQLKTEEIIQLFYNSYNPEATEGQNLTDSRNYTTPLVQPSVQGVFMNDQLSAAQGASQQKQMPSVAPNMGPVAPQAPSQQTPSGQPSQVGVQTILQPETQANNQVPTQPNNPQPSQATIQTVPQQTDQPTVQASVQQATSPTSAQTTTSQQTVRQNPPVSPSASPQPAQTKNKTAAVDPAPTQTPKQSSENTPTTTQSDSSQLVNSPKSKPVVPNTSTTPPDEQTKQDNSSSDQTSSQTQQSQQEKNLLDIPADTTQANPSVSPEDVISAVKDTQPTPTSKKPSMTTPTTTADTPDQAQQEINATLQQIGGTELPSAKQPTMNQALKPKPQPVEADSPAPQTQTSPNLQQRVPKSTTGNPNLSANGNQTESEIQNQTNKKTVASVPETPPVATQHTSNQTTQPANMPPLPEI